MTAPSHRISIPEDPLTAALLAGIDASRCHSLSALREALQECFSESFDRIWLTLWERGVLRAEPQACRPGEILREAAAPFLGSVRESAPSVLVLPAPSDHLHTDPLLVSRVLQALVVRCLESSSWESGAVVAYERRGGRPVFTIRSRAREEGASPQGAIRTMDIGHAKLVAEQAFEGRVEVDPGEGSLQLTLLLPESALVHCASQEDLPPVPAAEETVAGASGLVLVVDDSRTIRRHLESVLSKEHRVLTAESGPEAIHVAVDQQPDLVLLDVVMPGMDGYAVCARLKSDPRTEEIPVLFLTSLKGEAEETLALEAGAIDFITKPISPTAVAARVRNHLALKRSQDRIREISLLDGLTGIPNRRRFDGHLREEWSRAMRKGTTLALVMGDVDFFKRYNDHYGHAQGDACLRQVARCFSGAVRRAGDLAARFGGEEFACLLPETDLAGALEVAERIRLLACAMELPHALSEAGSMVTLSLGVACLAPEKGMDPTILVEAADRGLYAAKGAGRDRVEVSPGDTGT